MENNGFSLIIIYFTFLSLSKICMKSLISDIETVIIKNNTCKKKEFNEKTKQIYQY